MSYYTYVYLDPRKPGIYQYDATIFDHEPIYVGKGTKERAFYHLMHTKRVQNPLFRNLIQSIRRSGMEPIVKILNYFDDESKAYDAEAALISSIGSRIIRGGKEGPLSNICSDARPPSLGGKTYEEIYGENAADQRRQRYDRQLAAGGFFKGRHHTEETKRVQAQKTSLNNLARVQSGIHMDEACRGKISDRAKERYANGAISPAKRSWIVTAPDGTVYHVPRDGKQTLRGLCVTHDISYSALRKTFTDGVAISRGRTKGWSLMLDLTGQ